MFEELLEHRKLQTTASKRSQLAYLVRAQTQANIICAIEKEAGQGLLNNAQRAMLRRRIVEEYAKRPLPEATYETWHSMEEVSGYEPLPEPHTVVEVNPSAHDEQEESSDDDVEEWKCRLTKRKKIKPKRKPKRKPMTQVVSEYRQGNFDLYVKEKLARELLSAKSSLQLAEDETGENQSPSASPGQGESLESDLEQELHPDAEYARKTLAELQSGLVTGTQPPRRQWALERFVVVMNGWEMPGAEQDLSDYSLIKLHIHSLKLLLHASILKKQWQVAYKVFSVLIRFEFVDKRAIWPLGLEIIIQRKQELLATRTLAKREINKQMQFLDWIQLSYPTSHVNHVQKRTYQGPVFRAGSRTHAPLSIITGLWHLLVEQNYSRVREDVDELLLQAPYATDGAYYFLIAMCCMAENVYLVHMLQKYDQCGGFFDDTEDCGDLSQDPELFSSKETIKARISNNNAQARKMLLECDNLDFEYPKEEVETQLVLAWSDVGLGDSAPTKESMSNKDAHAASHDRDSYTLKNGKIVLAHDGRNAIPQKFMHRFVQPVPTSTETVPSAEWLEMVWAQEKKGETETANLSSVAVGETEGVTEGQTEATAEGHHVEQVKKQTGDSPQEKQSGSKDQTGSKDQMGSNN